MKVLNLRCAAGHDFEGWFASEGDFSAQSADGSLSCPICGGKEVGKLLAAPRLNVARRAAPEAAPADAAPATSGAVTLQSQWLRAVRHVMETTEDVGERFPEEARRIHYGEVEERGIRGRASSEDAAALREEGIEVMSLPVPDAMKGPVQ